MIKIIAEPGVNYLLGFLNGCQFQKLMDASFESNVGQGRKLNNSLGKIFFEITDRLVSLAIFILNCAKEQSHRRNHYSVLLYRQLPFADNYQI